MAQVIFPVSFIVNVLFTFIVKFTVQFNVTVLFIQFHAQFK